MQMDREIGYAEPQFGVFRPHTLRMLLHERRGTIGKPFFEFLQRRALRAEQQQFHQPAVPADNPEILFGSLPQVIGRPHIVHVPAAASVMLLQRIFKSLRYRLQYLAEYFVLAYKVVIDIAQPHARDVGDLPHRSPGKSFLHENEFRSPKHFLPYVIFCFLHVATTCFINGKVIAQCLFEQYLKIPIYSDFPIIPRAHVCGGTGTRGPFETAKKGIPASARSHGD